MREKEDRATYYHVIARDTDLNGKVRCIRCHSLADDVHEILPKSSHGPTRRHALFDISNRCCLCRDCHNRVHNQKGRGELLTILYNNYAYEYQGEAKCVLEEFKGNL